MEESIKTRIHNAFIERAPNSLTIDNLIKLIEGVNASQIESFLNEMIDDGLAVKRQGQGKIKDDYNLVSYNNIPSKEYITIGDIKVPRLLANDRARPEDINIYIESLAKKSVELENNIESTIDERLKGYWANIIVLFGIFIGLFSLIITFVDKVKIDASQSFWSVLSLNLAQVLPLAIVLGGFVFLLKKMFK